MKNTPEPEEEMEKSADQTQEQSPEPLVDAVATEDGGDPLLKIQDELAEAKDKYLRLYAEFDNYRRRTSKEKAEMIQGANEHLIKVLLPVVDDFERAEKAFGGKADKEIEGFLLIQSKLKKVLDQFGVKAMDSQGDFNPDLHEAITQIPAPNEKLIGKIVDVVEKGYLINEKVIRFAKVVVGS